LPVSKQAAHEPQALVWEQAAHELPLDEKQAAREWQAPV